MVLLIVMVLAHCADLWTTYLGLSRGCAEMNPIYYVAGWWGMIGMKVLGLSIIRHLSVRTGRTDILWMGIAAGFGAAVWNLLQLPRC